MIGIRLRGIALAVAVGLGLGGIARAADDPDLLKRGEYLTRAGDCIACHTAPGGEPYAGGLRIDTPFGPIYSPNITPDKATGIGAWSDDEFYRAMHEGIRKDGKYLYPVFPFPWYTHVAKGDDLAIKAYLFTLKGVNAPNKPPEFSFPYNIREALLTWRTLVFKEGNTPAAPDSSDRIARGSYLVNGLGHCGECHNRYELLGASKLNETLEGGEVDNWYAPNITSDKRQGIGAWSEDEIAKYLKSGVGPHGSVALGPMQETINDSLRYLTDEDLHDMAAYLKSTKAKETYANSEGGYARKGAPGEALYEQHCASCHGLEGKGVQGHVPALAQNGTVQSREPHDIIQAVLGGLKPRDGLGPMPAVGANLSDAEVASVVDYVRNAFGNAAPAGTKPDLVEKIRKTVSTPMLASRAQDCDKPQTDEVKGLAADGSLAKIATGDQVNLLPSIDALVGKLNPRNLDQADAFVTDLTGAYCAALFQAAPNGKEPERAASLGRFATLAYSRMDSRLNP